METVDKPKPDERKIICEWIRVGDKIEGSEACERIDLLTESYFEKLGHSSYGAWETLFRDPEDGRYWEKIYPQGEMHGGGPPALINLSEEEALGKYSRLFVES